MYNTDETSGPALSARLISALRDTGSGSRPVVTDDLGSWTVDDLDNAVRRAAGTLLAWGVRRGERVVVAIPSGRRWLQATLGVSAVGAIAVLVDPAESPSRIRALCRVFECSRMIGDHVVMDVAGLSPVVLDAGVPADPVEIAPLDCAIVLQTSGTTGEPKGVMHAHSRCARPGYLAEAVGCGPRDRVASASAGFSALGLFIGTLRPLAAGASIEMSARKPTIRSVLARVEASQITILSAVPTFWAQLATYLERRPSERRRLESVRIAIASGETLYECVVERVRRYTGVRLINGFGSAECGDIVLGTHDPSCRDLGLPIEGVDVRRDPHGRLMVRCPTATVGYLDRPDDTRLLVHGQWVRTADLVRGASRGWRHDGRADGAVKVAGRLLQPNAAEACLYEHPAVVEAAVVTTVDDHRRQRAGAFVAVRGADGGGREIDLQLRRLLTERFGTKAGSARLTLVSALPKLGSGKIDRQALARTLVA